MHPKVCPQERQMKRYIAIAVAAAILLAGCSEQKGKENLYDGGAVEYAKYFTIENADSTIKKIIITDLWSGGESTQTYKLVPRESYGGFRTDPYALPYPVERAVCMSTSHVAYLNALGKTGIIKGVSGTRFIYDSTARALAREEKIKDIGTESLPNYELIMSLNPDIVFAYGISGADNTYISKLRELGMKVMVIGDYLENHPLGRMECIKMFGLLTGETERADSIYTHVRDEYLSLKNRIAEKGAEKIKVLINSPYNGLWYIPGGDNYMSLLVEDAGGTVLGSRKGETKSSIAGIETVYRYALEAEIWLNPGDMSLETLKSTNPLFAEIPSVAERQVYNNSKRRTPAGGSDFWERGAVEPHIILKDLSLILHPELRMADSDTLKYHYRLR